MKKANGFSQNFRPFSRWIARLPFANLPLARLPLALLLLALLLSGCSLAEGKRASDVLQVLLRQESWLRWTACIVLVFLLFQAFRLFRVTLGLFVEAIRRSYRFIFVWGKRHWVLIGIFGTLLWLFSTQVADFVQDIEQRYLFPTYVNEFNYLRPEHLMTVYEAELARHVDPYQQEVVARRTREIAAKIHSTPLAIYESAYLECGLDPFRTRRDGVAAGWIQFTRVGLDGLQYRGKPVAFDDVLRACRLRDIETIMDLTELYLYDKYQRSGQKSLEYTIDLYLALFAPALIGGSHDQVVYAGYDNPRYFLNNGLDGWYTAENGQIFRKNSQKDGRITIMEIYLALESKKNALIRQSILEHTSR